MGFNFSTHSSRYCTRLGATEMLDNRSEQGWPAVPPSLHDIQENVGLFILCRVIKVWNASILRFHTQSRQAQLITQSIRGRSLHTNCKTNCCHSRNSVSLLQPRPQQKPSSEPAEAATIWTRKISLHRKRSRNFTEIPDCYSRSFSS